MKSLKRRFMAVIASLMLFPAFALAQGTTLNGIVEKVDKDKITLKTDSGMETVELGNGLKGAEQPKVGDKVTIRANRAGDKLQASSVNILKDGSPRVAPPAKASDRPMVPGGAEGKPFPGIK